MMIKFDGYAAGPMWPSLAKSKSTGTLAGETTETGDKENEP